MLPWCCEKFHLWCVLFEVFDVYWNFRGGEPVLPLYSPRVYCTNVPQLLQQLQDEDRNSAFDNSTIPNWISGGRAVRTSAGQFEGLVLVLDGHTDLVTSLSVNSDFEGFTAVVDQRGSYALPNSRGFLIRPGIFCQLIRGQNKVPPPYLFLSPAEDFSYIGKLRPILSQRTYFCPLVITSFHQTDFFSISICI